MGRSAGSIGAAAHAGQPVVVGRDLPDPGVGDDFIADPGISPVGGGTPGVIALDDAPSRPAIVMVLLEAVRAPTMAVLAVVPKSTARVPINLSSGDALGAGISWP